MSNKKLTPLQVINYIYQYTISSIDLKNDITIIHNIVEINYHKKVIFRSTLYESMITRQITSTLNKNSIVSYDFFIHLYNYNYLLLIYEKNKLFIGYTKVDIHGILPALLVPYKTNDKKTLQLFLKYIDPSNTRQLKLKREIKKRITALYNFFKINQLIIDLAD